MVIVCVHIHVKNESIEAFIRATRENAKNSLLESGVSRFDFLQETDNPEQFVLLEVYKSQEATKQHKETIHYLHWRDTVADMMVEPRKGINYLNLYPNDSGW